MLELKYVESNPNGGSYCYFPYRWTSETSIVIENFYLPRQETDGRGRNLITVGPGRFQASGDGLSIEPPQGDNAKLIVYFGYYRNGGTPSTMYYTLEYTATSNAIEGKFEIGNAYIKLNNSIVATGTTYTGTKITMQQDLCFLNSFNWNWNYIRGAKCGKVSFYENGVLSATYTPYEDDNGVAGYYDENNGVMIYSNSDPWVSGPAATSISVYASKSTLASTGETINIAVECENAWTVTGDTFLTLSSTGDTGSTTITATAPSYTGTTARTDTLTFTDSVTGDEWEIDIKQKKYTAGQPFYLGGDEIVEIYLGDDFISEAYLGEDLVFSNGSGPTPPPTPTGSTRTLTISNIPTPPTPTESYMHPSTWTQVQDSDNGTVELAIDWNDNDSEYDAVVTTSDWEGDPLTAITATYSNGTLTAEGDWGDYITIQYSYYDEDINCEQVPDDESFVEETFTGDTISLTFPILAVNGECQCGKDGGEWDYDNEICLDDAALIIDGVDIPDDGGTHEYRILDSDGNTVSVLSIDTSDWSYTYEDNPDGTISHTITTLNVDDYGDLSAGGVRWELTGFFYGEYDIQLDSSSLVSSMPDFDGSSVANYISWDSTEGDYVINTYSCYDEWNCMVNDCGNWNPNTGECDCV